jgi:hypothetical protein
MKPAASTATNSGRTETPRWRSVIRPPGIAPRAVLLASDTGLTATAQRSGE